MTHWTYKFSLTCKGLAGGLDTPECNRLQRGQRLIGSDWLQLKSLSRVVIPLNRTDIDECENSSSNVCDHTCVNTAGSFLCHCRSGFILAPDQHSCIPLHNCEFVLVPRIDTACASCGEANRLVFVLLFFFCVCCSEFVGEVGHADELRHLFLHLPGFPQHEEQPVAAQAKAG